MKDIQYFKLAAKNLLRDYKSEISQSDANYKYQPQFFDINKVLLDFNLDTDNDFSLMSAQHIIAKMLNLKSWSELINLNEDDLSKAKVFFDNSGYKFRRFKTCSVDFSDCERLSYPSTDTDYLVRCKKTPELMEIIQMNPNSLFYSVQLTNENLALIDADSEHIYVNIVPSLNTFRVHIPGSDWESCHSVEIRNGTT